MSELFEHLWPAVAAAAPILLAALAWLRGKRSAACFLVATALFLAAAAGPRTPAPRQETVHVVVSDVSGSMEPRLSATSVWLREEIGRAPVPDGQRLIELQMADVLREPGGPGGDTSPEALAAARGFGVNGDLLLVTDGRLDLDALLRAVPPRRLVLIPAPEADRPDARVVSAEAPSSLAEGASGRLEAVFASDRDADATWRLFLGDDEVASGAIRLRAGQPAPWGYTVAAANGVQRYRLALETAGDREPRNDTALLPVRASGSRRVAYLRRGDLPEEADALLARLRALEGLTVEVVARIPAADPSEFDLLVVNDLPLAEAGLTASELAPLADWIERGGRLLMAGATGAFGPGGYSGTALEAWMPVRFRPDDAPTRRLAILLDCSDSMNATDGGVSRIDQLRRAARRILETLDDDDLTAVVGFRDDLTAPPRFRPSTDRPALEADLLQLAAGGSTRIRRALTRTLRAFPEGVSTNEQREILLITDGVEGEAADDAAWITLGELARARGVRIDLLSTGGDTPGWIAPLRNGGAEGVASGVGDEGFASLLETLERHLARERQEWVLRGALVAPGLEAPPKVLCRTAPRRLAEVEVSLQAGAGDSLYPLLATRRMVGRTAALCTETYGGPLWADAAFLAALDDALVFLLEGTGRSSLLYEPGDEGFSLYWVGEDEPPPGALQTSDGALLRRVGRYQWRCETPAPGETLEILSGGATLERIDLPRLPPRELRATGNDPEFFAAAEACGVRILSSPAAWRPKPAEVGAEDRPVPLDWLFAALGVAALCAAFVLRLNARAPQPRQ